jgi:hypothetical protein
MYQISNTARTVSANLNDEDRETLNAYLQELQEKKGIVFSTFKECLFSLFSVENKPENIVKTPENTTIPESNPEPETITIEVERKLTENEVLIELNEDQLIVAKQIAENRAEKEGKDADELNVLFLKSFFNKGNLYNWHGNFYTGL